MNTLIRLFRYFHPVLFYRRFRLAARLSRALREREGRAPTAAEYTAIADEVERRLP